MAQDTARAWGQNQLNASGEAWLSSITDNTRARMNLSVDRNGRFSGEADVLLPLIDTPRALFFTQLGVRSMAVSGDKGRWIANVGLGQRWFPQATVDDSGNLMLGVNAFIDHDVTRAHNRGGAGVEVRYDGVRVSSNLYAPLSRWKNSPDFDRYEERPARGWDVRVEAPFPFYRPVTLTGGYTQWYGDEVDVFGRGTLRALKKDPKIWDVGVKYTPFSLFSAYVTQRSMEGGLRDTVAGISFTYHLGMPWSQQTRRIRGNESATVDGFRYELVNRENRMPLAYQKKKEEDEEEVTPPTLQKHGLVVEFFIDGKTTEVTEGKPFVKSDDFIDRLGQGYQSIVKMVVKKYDHGEEDKNWSPSSVNWGVTSQIESGDLPTWNRNADDLVGMEWVADDSASVVSGTTSSAWVSGEIRGPVPKTQIVYLADVVGSRKITVTATTGGETNEEPAEFTFGAGPLSEFTSTGSTVQQWARLSTNSTSTGFQSLTKDNASDFPAAVSGCNGTVNPQVETTNGPYNSSTSGIKDASDWSGERSETLFFNGPWMIRYAEKSNMATAEQLLAVSVYDTSYNQDIYRKGAAFAAGWSFGSAWTGELFFYSSSFNAVAVDLSMGSVSSSNARLTNTSPVAVCVG